MEFNLEILKKLSEHHKTIMNMISEKINDLDSDKEIYQFINNYYLSNNLIKAFPIGISINQIVAHNSFHPNNIIKLKPGDLIKIDFGLVEDGNIIDSARTFVYKGSCNEVKGINDSKIIVKKLEEFISEELKSHGKVNIQRISTMTNALIVSMGYNSLGLIGGHSIEYNKVHGKKLILNKPLSLLGQEASNFIDKNWILEDKEMFALEIYIPEFKAEGELIQNTTLPITHYQINIDKRYDKDVLNKLSKKELETINRLFNEVKDFVYEWNIHEKYNPQIINNLIKQGLIIKHYPLEFVNKNKSITKYIQYEDCYLISEGNLINLMEI